MSSNPWWRTTGPQVANWAATIALLIVTVVIGVDYAPGDARRWAAIALALILAAVQRTEWLEERYGESGVFVQMAAILCLTVALALLGANATALIIVGMVMSAHATYTLPGGKGFAWIGVYILLLFVYLMPFYPDPTAGLFNTMGTAVGFLFFGSAAYAQKRAEAADVESRRLLDQLQAANEQLRDHASRAEALAVAQERNRVAREVHDTLGHRLTVAAVQLEGAQKLIERDPEKATRMVATVRRQVVEGLAELRSTVAMLRTPLERDLTLPSALTRLAHDFQSATGVAAHVALPAEMPPLDDERRLALLRAAQEALTNVQRHARARTVRLELRILPADGDRVGEIQLRAEDDGVGLPDERSGGYGLQGLRERAEELGGSLSAAERPGGGASISFRVPLSTESPISPTSPSST